MAEINAKRKIRISKKKLVGLDHFSGAPAIALDGRGIVGKEFPSTYIREAPLYKPKFINEDLDKLIV